MSTGLFFVRRESTWMTRRISSSRPMTGSMLALARVLGEVAAVLLERLVLLFGVVARDAMRCRAPLQRVEHGVAGDARAGSRSPTPPETSVIASRMCSVDRYSSSSRVAFGVGGLEDPVRVRRERRLADRRAAHRGRAASVSSRRTASGAGSDADALEHPADDALGLREQRGEQVLAADLGVALPCAAAWAAPSASAVLRVKRFGSSAMGSSGHNVV